MNSPGTTRSSRLLMSSRPRFIDDGSGSVQPHRYFSQLSSYSCALPGLFKAYVGAREYAFHPSLNRTREIGIRSTITDQLANKRSILLAIGSDCQGEQLQALWRLPCLAHGQSIRARRHARLDQHRSHERIAERLRILGLQNFS
jgi:hypothetical protein